MKTKAGEELGSQTVAPGPARLSDQMNVVYQNGMTLRQYYAGLAMQGIIAGKFSLPGQEYAPLAVEHADALLAALAEGK